MRTHKRKLKSHAKLTGNIIIVAEPILGIFFYYATLVANFVIFSVSLDQSALVPLGLIAGELILELPESFRELPAHRIVDYFLLSGGMDRLLVITIRRLSSDEAAIFRFGSVRRVRVGRVWIKIGRFSPHTHFARVEFFHNFNALSTLLSGRERCSTRIYFGD